MNVPLILDTCVFSDKQFLYNLRTYHGRKILPAVAYSELCVHFIKNKKKSHNYLDHLLNSMDIEVDELNSRRAKNAALYCIDSRVY